MGQHYCDNRELARLVSESQAAGRVSEELARMVNRIASGALAHHGIGLDREDAMQEAQVWLLLKLDGNDPSGAKGGVFNYISTSLINLFRQMHRARRKHRHVPLEIAEWEPRP